MRGVKLTILPFNPWFLQTPGEWLKILPLSCLLSVTWSMQKEHLRSGQTWQEPPGSVGSASATGLQLRCWGWRGLFGIISGRFWLSLVAAILLRVSSGRYCPVQPFRCMKLVSPGSFRLLPPFWFFSLLFSWREIRAPGGAHFSLLRSFFCWFENCSMAAFAFFSHFGLRSKVWWIWDFWFDGA